MGTTFVYLPGTITCTGTNYVMDGIHTCAHHFCKLCTPVTQYPGYVRVCPLRKTEGGYGHGYYTTFVYLPGTSVSCGRLAYCTRNLFEFCKTPIPVSGRCVSSAKIEVVFYWVHTRGFPPGYYPCRNSCKLCTPVPQYPGYGYAIFKIPGCGYGHEYNIRVPTRSFSEFCSTSITVPGTCINSAKLPYPVPGIHKPYRTQPWEFLNSRSGAFRVACTWY